MTCALEDLSLKDLRLDSLSAERPEKHFNTLPYQLWSQNNDYAETIHQVISDWQAATGRDVCETFTDIACNFPLYLAPECPPNVLPHAIRFLYIFFLWDDATDVLESAEHETIQVDLRAALLSEVKLGRHARCEFEINELYVQSLLDLFKEIESVGSRFKDVYHIFDVGIEAQRAHPLHKMTWESHKAHRATSVGGNILSRLMPAINGIQVSTDELESVSDMMYLGDLITGLTNDFQSFHKEFEGHFLAGTLDSIHNGMAVLMSNYGYDEQEAGRILKQEVVSLERKLLSEYEAWNSSSAPKSDGLRRYLLVSILTVGGMNHWQSITPRYHRTNLVTTEADRAQLVGRAYDRSLQLPGYPPPALALTGKPNGARPTGGLMEEKKPQPANETESTPRGTGMLAPFEKAPAGEIVLAPWKYIRSLPGKKTLGRVIEALEAWFKVPESSIKIIRETTRMLFEATLMLDDIQDGSQLRRGRPAAHTVFGQPQTINSATYLFVHGYRQMDYLKYSEQCGDIFMDELESLALGQGLELNWRFNTTLPSIREYLVMVDNKTGGFFRLVHRLLQVESESEPNPDLVHLFTLLGRYYQIRDDYMNLASEEYTAKKGFCEDLSEGKFSFPLIHSLQNTACPDRIREVLFDRADKSELSVEMKQFVLDEMQAAGSLTYTKKTLDELFDALLETLEKVEAELGTNKKLLILLLWLKV